MPQGVSPIAYILVCSKKVNLRDLYYEYDYRDIMDLLEIVMCENYNNQKAIENASKNIGGKNGNQRHY